MTSNSQARVWIKVPPKECHRWEHKKIWFTASCLEFLGETHAKYLTLETILGGELVEVMEI